MTFDDREYFGRRAAEERMRAQAAASPAAAKAHLILAATYEALVKKSEGPVVHTELDDGQRERA